MTYSRPRFWQILIAAAFGACDGKATGPGVDMLPPITVAPPTATISVGQTAKFTAILTSGIRAAGFRWTSVDPRVATVDSSGTVTGVGAGNTFIQAQVGTVAAQSIVNVTAP